MSCIIGHDIQLVSSKNIRTECLDSDNPDYGIGVHTYIFEHFRCLKKCNCVCESFYAKTLDGGVVIKITPERAKLEKWI